MSIMITSFVESNRKYMYNYVINVFWTIGQTLSQSVQYFFQCFATKHPSMPVVSIDYTHNTIFQILPQEINGLLIPLWLKS
jgi:hypothetical protein